MWRGCDLAAASAEASGRDSSTCFGGICGNSCVHQQREMQCLLHWFGHWSKLQKARFLKELLGLLLPLSADCLDFSMSAVNLSDRPPSIFECQLKLFRQWTAGWPEDLRSYFVSSLSSVDGDFGATLKEEVLRLQVAGL